jgi:hypothetical protein
MIQLTPAPPTALKMVEVPTALVIVLPPLVNVENRVSVEIGVEDLPEPPAPPAPPAPSVPVPVAELEPVPETAEALPVAVAEAPVIPVSEPAAPVAVPGATNADVAARAVVALPVATETGLDQIHSSIPADRDHLPEAQ